MEDKTTSQEAEKKIENKVQALNDQGMQLDSKQIIENLNGTIETFASKIEKNLIESKQEFTDLKENLLKNGKRMDGIENVIKTLESSPTLNKQDPGHNDQLFRNAMQAFTSPDDKIKSAYRKNNVKCLNSKDQDEEMQMITSSYNGLTAGGGGNVGFLVGDEETNLTIKSIKELGMYKYLNIKKTTKMDVKTATLHVEDTKNKFVAEGRMLAPARLRAEKMEDEATFSSLMMNISWNLLVGWDFEGSLSSVVNTLFTDNLKEDISNITINGIKDTNYGILPNKNVIEKQTIKSNTAGKISYSDLLKLNGNFKGAFTAGSAMVMNRQTLFALLSLTNPTTGEYLFKNGVLNFGINNIFQFLDIPIALDDTISGGSAPVQDFVDGGSYGTGDKPILLANFKRAGVNRILKNKYMSMVKREDTLQDQLTIAQAISHSLTDYRAVQVLEIA